MTVREIVSDALIVSGAGGVTFGIWLVHAPAACVVGGAFVAGLGYLIGRAR